MHQHEGGFENASSTQVEKSRTMGIEEEHLNYKWLMSNHKKVLKNRKCTWAQKGLNEVACFLVFMGNSQNIIKWVESLLIKQNLKIHGLQSMFFYESGSSFKNKNPLKKRGKILKIEEWGGDGEANLCT